MNYVYYGLDDKGILRKNPHKPCPVGLFICDDNSIWEVKTDEKYRRKGLMTKLFKMILSWNRDYSLYVYPDNIPAINLYLKLGFTFDESEPENKYGSKLMIYKK